MLWSDLCAGVVVATTLWDVPWNLSLDVNIPMHYVRPASLLYSPTR
jgi:hypothetical protein